MVVEREPSIQWSEIARMRDHLAHRYFDTSHAIVQATVDNDVAELDAAVIRLRHVIDLALRRAEPTLDIIPTREIDL